MNRKYLCIVRSNDDKHDAIAMLHSMMPDERIVRSVAGKDAHLWLKNGDTYQVWSLEQWWDGTTCGAMFDQIFVLANPLPKFVEEALRTCEKEKP